MITDSVLIPSRLLLNIKSGIVKNTVASTKTHVKKKDLIVILNPTQRNIRPENK